MRPRATLAAAGLALASTGAHAHGGVEGLGSFFGGLFHPVIEPAHLIAMLALGLLLGQRPLAANRAALLLLAAGSALGAALAGLGQGAASDPALLAAAALAGLCVAAARALPRPAAALLAALVGLGIGLGSAPESGSSAARAAMLLGSALGAVWWTADVALVSHALQQPWLRVGVRVAGSWLGACALLVMALYGRAAWH